MRRKAAEILKAALALPREDRAALTESLLASLDAHADKDCETAWAIEIDRRLAQLDAGSVPTIPSSEVRQRLFERSRHRALKRLRDGLDLRWVPGSREDLHRR
jgi:putative addiction module component (TIGR02574 family)